MKPALNREQMIAALPEVCMSRLLSDNSPILIKRGQEGYRPYNADPDEFNRVTGVTPAQREAMIAGSMFGWDVPGANPENYDEDGRPISNSRRRRREAAPQHGEPS